MKRWFVLLFGVFCYGLFTVLLVALMPLSRPDLIVGWIAA